VEPDFAIFGEKDFQQLFLIKQWVKEEQIPVTVIAAPLVRDSDGLALSSRNVRLGDDGRRQALVISKALFAARESEHPEEVMAQILRSEPAFTLDYAVIIDEESFEIASPQTKHRRALIAGWVNGVRLLDNMAMSVNA
jgi:pantoate--beta-alanine ligase